MATVEYDTERDVLRIPSDLDDELMRERARHARRLVRYNQMEPWEALEATICPSNKMVLRQLELREIAVVDV